MTSPNDLFGSGSGGGAFPKLAELDGKLILLKPSVVEKAPKYKSPGEYVDRATADLVVFEDDGSYEAFEDVYFSQVSIVNAAKKALKPGAKPFILGRVKMFPSKEMRNKGVDTSEKIVAARADWLRKGGKGDEPGYAWGLDDYTPEEAQVAMKYVTATSPFAAAE
jgi:hypothetical protein